MITRKLQNKVLLSGIFYTSLFGTLAITGKALVEENMKKQKQIMSKQSQMLQESQVFDKIV